PALRWLIWSRQHKAELMRKPDPDKGELKHSVWDTWGIVPAGFTVTYLVFDASDSLALAANSRAPGRFKGIPCEVPDVSRLERQWYAVTFYTDEDWGSCTYSDPKLR